MTPRPAINSETFKIDLPRPRPEGITMDKMFFNIVAKIKRKIVEDVKKQKIAGEYESQAYSTIT